MKILFICDLNSIHAQKWIDFFIKRKHDVTVYSTTPFAENFRGLRVFSSSHGSPAVPASAGTWIQKIFESIPTVLWTDVLETLFVLKKSFSIRYDTARHRNAVSPIVHQIQPNIIHALRIPNEGFIAARLQTGIPFVISTWGNDLIYWARKRLLTGLTRETLGRASLLLSDCERDVRLSREYGYPREKPFLELPGSGGMSKEQLEEGRLSLKKRMNFPAASLANAGRPIFLSLRGFGSQDIDNVPLLEACRLLAKLGERFTLILVGRKGGYRYFKLVHLIKRYRLENKVILLDELPHKGALRALQSADFYVSIAHNDGLPNSLMEAMTYGAIPLTSDLESIREWVEEGKNGYFFDPSDAPSIARAMERAMHESAKQAVMRRLNHALVCGKGNYEQNMARVESVFLQLASHWEKKS